MIPMGFLNPTFDSNADITPVSNVEFIPLGGGRSDERSLRCSSVVPLAVFVRRRPIPSGCEIL
jgi:hypothetical protein